MLEAVASIHHDWIWTFWNSIYPWAFFGGWIVFLVALMVWPYNRRHR